MQWPHHLFSALQNVEDFPTEAKCNSFPLTDLLPAESNTFYRYNGSLTTNPPCDEVVIWTVFKVTYLIMDVGSACEMGDHEFLFMFCYGCGCLRGRDNSWNGLSSISWNAMVTYLGHAWVKLCFKIGNGAHPNPHALLSALFVTQKK